jgi:hypothetical protein
MRRATALCLICALGVAAGGRRRWPKPAPTPEPNTTPVPTGFDAIECKKCMSVRAAREPNRAAQPAHAPASTLTAPARHARQVVMRLLTPQNKGCSSGNATTITQFKGAPSVYCESLLPKRRECVVYSFAVSAVWDFDNAMLKRGCRVLSFDPFCCGAAHKMSPKHDFVPVGLGAYDGLVAAPPPTNTTHPVMTLKTIMESYEHPKIDVLRMPVATAQNWKTLKNLINTGAISARRPPPSRRRSPPAARRLPSAAARQHALHARRTFGSSRSTS